MQPKLKVEQELKRVKRLYEEELTRGHLYTAEALKQRGWALCWVLDRYWGDIVVKKEEP